MVRTTEGFWKEIFKTQLKKLGLGRRFLFQQDNDPKHTSKIAKDILNTLNINTLEWVVRSPVMNPIEHLWDHLKRELQKKTFRNKNELRERIEDIWKNSSPEVTHELVDSMPRRLEVVIAAHGGPTKY